MFALIDGGTVTQFPYSRAQLKADNPGVSYPRGDLSALGLVPVEVAPMPDASAGQKAVQDATPTLQGGKWVLGWTLQDKTPGDLAKERAKMRLTRFEFAIAVMRAGIINAQEAEAWAGGTSLPSAVQAAFSTLPEGQQTAARIEALAVSHVRRNHPFIALLQGTYGLTDEQVDGLFG